MSSRTRYFLIGSALIVLVGLGTGLVAYYNGALPGTGAARIPELAYVPADASAVAYADVRDIMGSEFRQKLRTMMPAGTEKDRLFAETGVDVERDIDSVVAGIAAPGAPGVPGGQRALVLMRGRFDAARIESLATQHGLTVDTYKGTRMLLSSDGAADAGEGIAFLEPGLLAFGGRDRLRAAVDAGHSSGGIAHNAAVMAYVEGAERSGNAWIVGHFDPMAAEQAMPAQIRQQLPPLDWFVVSADVDRTVHGLVRADARDDVAGEQLRNTVNGALSAARLLAGRDSRLDTTLNSVQVSGTGKTMEVSFVVGPDVLDAVKGNLPTMPALPAPAPAR